MSPFSGQAAELDKVSIQFKWFHQFQFAGYYAAKEKGFFAEEGLDVELREYSRESDPISDVLSGKAEYGIADCPSSCNWNSQRPNLREDLAHLVDNTKRRICGIASAGSPLFSV